MEKNVKRYKKHMIISFSTGTCLAECSECGTVPLAVTNDANRYPACGNVTRTTHGGKYTRRTYKLYKPGTDISERHTKVHTVLSYDTEALIGICIACGKVPIKVWDSPSKRVRGISHVMCLYKHVTSHPTLMLTISPEELLSAWNGTCDICSMEFSIIKPYYVDHNHKSHKFRGYLCMRCNFLVGHLEADKPDLLDKAIEYIKTRT